MKQSPKPYRWATWLIKRLAAPHLQEELLGDRQPEHRIADEFEQFVLLLADFFLVAVGDVFICPRAMRDGAFEQGQVLKLIAEKTFEFGDRLRHYR